MNNLSPSSLPPSLHPHPPDAVSDQAVVHRVLDGDHAAFAVLVRRHNQRLYRAARVIVGDDSEAEDVVQEAWVLAFERLAQHRPGASFGGWVARIAVNEALGRVRNRVRRRGRDLTLVEGEAAMTDQDPEEVAAAAELTRAVEARIDALPLAYRTVFVLREIEELTTAQAAEILDVSEEVVRVRLFRARQMLQSALIEHLGTPTLAAFRFDGERCDRMTAGVLMRLGIGSG